MHEEPIMSTAAPVVSVRPTREDDLPALVELLNAIIRIGGTTAFETPVDVAEFSGWFVGGEHCLACFTAERSEGVSLPTRAVGFQALGTHPKLPAGCGDIATFVRVGETGGGIGRALFRHTLEAAREQGLNALNATIRADNVGGLAFYSRLGFVDHAVARAVPLRDGTPVDRVSKRYVLET